MQTQQHTSPEALERYSFLWSEARLVVAAAALFLGGVPPLLYLRLPYGLASNLLTLGWIISGIAAVYLLYQWYTHKQTLFGAKHKQDTVAFLVSVVSGINLGLTGVMRNNIGLSISSHKVVLIFVGIIYVVAAAYLFKRWQESKQRLF